jgi:CheY-like chemotaxis protein
MIYAGQDQARQLEALDLSRLVEEMLELLKVSVSKQIVLTINLDRNLPALLGNAPQLRQVVMNLVINASEAIGEQTGVVQVATSRVTRGGHTVANSGAHLPGDYVRLEVSDTGSGMTEQTKAKIFDPFFTTKFAGRGLGLAVVQGIVRDHHGAIEVTSTPSQGAKFQVWLPCTEKQALENQNVAHSSGSEQTKTRTGTIMLVEDEEVLRLATSRALRNRGFAVLEASDGTTALDMVRRQQVKIDVILLDVTLPGRSSREVFEEAVRVRPNLRIILSSAYDRKTVDATFAGLRITHFLRKPFQLRHLVAVLQDVLAN